MTKVFKKITIIFCLVFAVVVFSACNLIREPSPDPQPHIIAESRREENPVRPYHGNNETVKIAQSDSGNTSVSAERRKIALDEELYALAAVLQAGKKPDLTDCHNSVVSVVEEAEKILGEILLNGMPDYEKVHAIHDYLVYYTAYDYSLYDDYLADSSGVDKFDASFDVRGVFINKEAVCDGLSKAFVLLCGMENIRAVTVAGAVNSNGTSIPHAWNRVLLGGKWYNVDCTFDMYNVQSSNNEIKKYLSHAYFLVGSQSMVMHSASGIRDFDGDGNSIIYISDSGKLAEYNADEYYGYFEQEKLAEISGTQYYYSAASQAELNAIFKYIKSQSFAIGKIEIRVTFIGSSSDAFNTAFMAAYTHIGNSDYKADAAIRGVNDTVFCFIYK